MTVTVRQLGPIVWSKALPGYTVRQLTPIIWYQDPPKGAVRQAITHVLQQSAALGQVRQAAVHVLQPQRKNPTLIGIGAIYALINSESSVVWSASNSTLGSPSTDTSIANTNTSIQLTALPVSGFAGTYALHYNRTSLGAQFSSTQWLLGTISAATTIHALIPQINAAYGVYLDPTDIVDGSVAANATQILLQTASTSYVYAPGQSVYLQNTVALATATPNTLLPGFDNASGTGPRLAVLLAHFDGTNGQTTTVDSTGFNTITLGPSTTLSTAQSKFGGSALTFGASASVATVPDNPLLRLTGNFTVEAWCYMTNVSNDVMFIDKSLNATLTNRSWFEFSARQLMVKVDGTNAASVAIGSNGAIPPANQWFHIAFVKQGSVLTAYVNGVSVGTLAMTATWGASVGSNLTIGNNYVGATQFPGFIDEVRISNLARYTANFTPQTAPFTAD